MIGEIKDATGSFTWALAPLMVLGAISALTLVLAARRNAGAPSPVTAPDA
ncbi:hypothetical protein [Saccharopolyspora flava]|uniref:Uncharacterized protein n=1 Tax=Saccharopolyspora flava TaxID=95161 RepID=A0A1I6UE94_9PSEU|nr:hypothetical protein [Saccharopolyspora flava]SFS99627.1 hypothetical protein SAMN05660874_04825 [Saccharopolyspora flava]